MTEDQRQGSAPPDGSPAYVPEFLDAYDKARRPLGRELVAGRRKAERRIRRRRPWRFLSRGDEAVEQRPLPVLELRAGEEPPGADAGIITGLLLARSANQPVAVLAEAERTDPEKAPNGEGGAAEDLLRTEADVRGLVEEFAKRRTEVADPDWRSPDPLEFPRTESLLALFQVFGTQAESSGRPSGGWLEPREADSGVRSSPEIAEALRSRAAEERSAARRGAGDDGRLRTARSARVWAVRAGQGVLDGVGRLVYQVLYAGLYTVVDRIRGNDGKDGNVPAFDWFDQKVMTPLGFVVNLLLGLFLLLGVQNVPDLETLEQVIAVLVFSFIALLRGLVYLCWSQPWRPYRWLTGQFSLQPETEQSLFPDHRIVAQEVGRAYQAVVYGPSGPGLGKRRRAELGEKAHRLRLLLVNAVLADLEEAYPKRRYRTAFDRPVLIADRTATRWDGVSESPARRIDLVEAIEEVRTTEYAPDPLVVVTVVPGPVGADRPPDAPEDRNGERTLVQEITDWALRRHRGAHLGPSRVLSWDLGPTAGARAALGGRIPDGLRGREARVPSRRRRRQEALRRAVVSLAVLAPLLGAGWAVDHFNGECWRPMVRHQGVWGATTGSGARDCVGFTDGSFPFDPRLESVQDRIREQNDAIDTKKDPYVTVVYFGQMSVRDPDADNSRLAGVQGELAGLALRQEMHNDDAVNQGVPLIRLLLANTGPGWAHGETVAERIGEEMRKDDSIMAAVGFGQSLTTTTATIGALSKFGLPMVSSTATYDDIARIGEERTDFFFPIAPSNTRLARQAAQWGWSGAESADGSLEPSRSAVAVADDSSTESYGVDLAGSFMARFTALGGEAGAEAAEGFPPGVVPYGGEGQPSLQDVVREVCADPPELFYYAGRSADFGGFLNALQQTGRCPGGVRVMGSDDIAQYATDNLTHLGDVSGQTPVYYTPLAATGTWGLTGGNGERPFYANLARLSEELDLPSEIDVTEHQDRVRGPSVAHAAMAYDTLTVVSDSVDRAQRSQFGPERSDEPPSDLLSAIQRTRDLVGVSGTLAFDRPGDGYWFDDKLVQLVQAGPQDTQHVLAACGRITFERWAPGPNCLP
ncbi:hypothetical protein [Actinorugispora endophytica]|uniref:ABC-type branched-subunit amino acid transport system substrate-binding protein n=1 Tax=Actinorugispora endophytica TaxID=1605990 RepID=A0A4R6V7C8_9ACTN|nr:hypothetical protein [Actinorugispora endophytica]TDQ55132.1 ABC-type branched-subunit amino acid transport system substrate-binding protein [Actinorugispora endophytica]